jgi:predicted nucleic acid-binding protein
LLIEEERSRACRSLLRHHSQIAVWTFTRVELASALSRLERQQLLQREGRIKADERLTVLSSHWTRIEAFEEVAERAERLVGSHPLSAADALQLAAALILVSERPRRRSFITADARLGQAAAAEGFNVHLANP